MISLTLANIQMVLGWSGSFTRTMPPAAIVLLFDNSAYDCAPPSVHLSTPFSIWSRNVQDSVEVLHSYRKISRGTWNNLVIWVLGLGSSLLEDSTISTQWSNVMEWVVPPSLLSTCTRVDKSSIWVQLRQQLLTAHHRRVWSSQWCVSDTSWQTEWDAQRIRLAMLPSLSWMTRSIIDSKNFSVSFSTALNVLAALDTILWGETEIEYSRRQVERGHRCHPTSCLPFITEPQQPQKL